MDIEKLETELESFSDLMNGSVMSTQTYLILHLKALELHKRGILSDELVAIKIGRKIKDETNDTDFGRKFKRLF